MIVASIELHSAIDGRTTELGTLIIDNLGTGTPHKGNYRCRMYRKGDAKRVGGARKLIRNAKPIREGSVEGHLRTAEPVANLVVKSLLSMGYK